MTDQPRAACVVCFARYPASPGQRKCDDCDPTQRVTAPKAKFRARAKFQPLNLAELPEPSEADLANYLDAAQ